MRLTLDKSMRYPYYSHHLQYMQLSESIVQLQLCKISLSIDTQRGNSVIKKAISEESSIGLFHFA